MNLSENIHDPKPLRHLVFNKISKLAAEDLFSQEDPEEAIKTISRCLQPAALVDKFAISREGVDEKVKIVEDFHRLNYEFC